MDLLEWIQSRVIKLIRVLEHLSYEIHPEEKGLVRPHHSLSVLKQVSLKKIKNREDDFLHRQIVIGKEG